MTEQMQKLQVFAQVEAVRDDFKQRMLDEFVEEVHRNVFGCFPDAYSFLLTFDYTDHTRIMLDVDLGSFALDDEWYFRSDRFAKHLLVFNWLDGYKDATFKKKPVSRILGTLFKDIVPVRVYRDGRCWQ